MPPSIPGKKSFTVIVSEDLYEALKTWAEMKEWSLSKTARRFIEIGMDSELTRKTTTSKKPSKGKQ